MSDPIAAADAVVAAIDPGLGAPGAEALDVVLVTGPWLAGHQQPDRRAAGPDARAHLRRGRRDWAAEAPAAVVFVVSAIAPMTESDCALIDFATNYTDLVVGVVSKIDAHRDWRDVLAADRALLAARAPRYPHVPWVGAAAAPDLGEPQLDELVDLLAQRLGDPDVSGETGCARGKVRLQTVIGRYQSDGAGRTARRG